jgi:hypothetical protein
MSFYIIFLVLILSVLNFCSNHLFLFVSCLLSAVWNTTDLVLCLKSSFPLRILRLLRSTGNITTTHNAFSLPLAANQRKSTSQASRASVSQIPAFPIDYANIIRNEDKHQSAKHWRQENSRVKRELSIALEHAHFLGMLTSNSKPSHRCQIIKEKMMKELINQSLR